MHYVTQPQIMAALLVGQDGRTELSVSSWDPVTGQRQLQAITSHRTLDDALERLATTANHFSPSRAHASERYYPVGTEFTTTLLCGCLVTRPAATIRMCDQHRAGHVTLPVR